MATDKICNHKRMKTMNTGALLAALNRHSPVSRIELTKMLGLDGTTITHLVRELLARKLIKPAGFATPALGRPKQLLQLNANGRQAVGLQLEPHKISGVVINLRGQIKNQETVTLDPGDSQKIILCKIRTIGEKLIKKAIKTRLLGIGLAAYGIIDKESGVIVQSSLLPASEGVNIYDFLKETFKLPCAAEDTSRSEAIAEHWFGAAMDIDDFVLLDLGIGIGCAIVTGGRPLHGSTSSAGEMGHTIVVPDGKVCRCGMKGCLETVAAIPSVERIFAERYRRYGSLPYSEIAAMAKQGNSAAVEVVAETGKYIGMATSNLINILNPGHLIICGELLSAGDVLEDAIKASLKSHTIASSYKALQITRGQIGRNSAAVGTATLILSGVFGEAI